MTITTVDGVVNALGNSAQALVVNKASLANATSGGFASLWRATGIPGQGAIPSTAAVCNNALLGGFSFTNPTGAERSYLGRAFLLSANTATDVQLHDRLAHMGGLSGTVTTAQTCGVDCTGTGDNLVARRGDANYSDVQWWLEWFTDTGATVVNATCAVVYDDGSTANIVIALAATMRAGRMLPIQSTTAGRFIRSITTVQLSATTGTVGNFGVSATRALGGISMGLANAGSVYDWAMLGLPRVHDSACLTMIMVPGTTSTGVLYGNVKMIQG